MEMESKIDLQGLPARASIDPAATVGMVTLKAADLSQLAEYYTQVIGLQPLAQDEGRWLLGAGERPILALEAAPGAPRPPARATGLYHTAILFPSRRALAVKVTQLAGLGLRLGEADHLVSEAFYLSDPEGNGLELYHDRPAYEWTWQNGRVLMASEPIDWPSFLAEVAEDDPALGQLAAPEGTRLGHVHLKVSDLDLAERFYHQLLGFDITARLPGALFVSAGGYHHHIGMNTWESRGGPPAPESSRGLGEFSLWLPNPAEVERLARRAEAAGVPVEPQGQAAVLRDPFQNRVRLAVGKAGR